MGMDFSAVNGLHEHVTLIAAFLKGIEDSRRTDLSNAGPKERVIGLLTYLRSPFTLKNRIYVDEDLPVTGVISSKSMLAVMGLIMTSPLIPFAMLAVL